MLREALRQIVSKPLELELRRMAARPLGRSLSALAIVYGSDKRTGHNFAPVYARHLAPRRRHITRVLEIGVGGYIDPRAGGASLRMWRSYFPKAEVIGLDINAKEIDEPRIRFYQGDQGARGDLERIAALGPYDVIIDDGSHYQPDVTLSFEVLYPALKPGGIYVIEDLETAYTESTGGGPIGHEGTALSLARTLVDAVNREYIPDAETVLEEAHRGIVGVHVYSNIMFIERAGGLDRALTRSPARAAADFGRDVTSPG